MYIKKDFLSKLQRSTKEKRKKYNEKILFKFSKSIKKI
jgi:hypothetical protein